MFEFEPFGFWGGLVVGADSTLFLRTHKPEALTATLQKHRLTPGPETRFRV